MIFLLEEGKMVVKLLQLKEEDEEKVHDTVWAKLGNQGKLNMNPIVIKLVDENHPA